MTNAIYKQPVNKTELIRLITNMGKSIWIFLDPIR